MSDLELRLSLEQARAGMRLARALLDANGQVLMTQDTQLSDSALHVLRRRDITELWVYDPQAQSIDHEAQNAVLRQHHRERLARLFRHAAQNPDDRFLLALMTRYRQLDPL